MRIKFYLKCTINEWLLACSAFDEACTKSKSRHNQLIFFNDLGVKIGKNSG